MLGRLPDVPTSEQQWQVIAWSAILLFIVLGTAGFYFAWNPPAEKLEQALALRYYSWCSWGLAAGIYSFKWWVGRFLV